MAVLTGNWTVLIELISCILFARTQEQRFSKRISICIAAAFLAGMLLLENVYLDIPRLPEYIVMLLNIIVLKFVPMMVLLFLLLSGGRCTAVFVFSQAFAASELVAAVVQAVFLTAAESVGIVPGVLRGMVTAMGILLCFLLLFWVQHAAGFSEPVRVRCRSAIPALLVSYICFIVSYVYGWGSMDFDSVTIRYFSITIFLSGILILFLLQYTMREAQIQDEMTTMQHILDLRYQQYQDYVDSTAYLSRQLHDMKHQLAGLRAAAGEDLGDYLNSLDRSIARYETWNVSGNPVLDGLMTQKRQYCAENNIQLLCNADGKVLAGLPARDICTIFGNLLDNAAEAAGKLEAPDDRIIQVQVGKKNGFVLVRVENRCLSEPDWKPDGLPQTTKPNAREHGIGLASVRLTVEERHGTLRLSAEDGWFTARILLPCAQSD